MSGNSIPYRWIDGLPEKAQRQIERNFLEVQKQLGAASSTVFDCIIDPRLSASNPGAHNYKNLTDAVANETVSSTKTLCIGVLCTPGSTIQEPANQVISLAGSVQMIAMGNSSAVPAYYFSNSRQVWDLNNATINQGNHEFTVQGLTIFSTTGTSTTPFSNGLLTSRNCDWYQGDSLSAPSAQIRIANCTSSYFLAFETGFHGVNPSTAQAVCWGCAFLWTSCTAAYTTWSPGNDIYFDGWIQNSGVSTTTITVNPASGHTAYMNLRMAPVFVGGAGGTLAGIINVNGAGETYIKLAGNESLQPTFRAVVAAGAGPTWLEGNCWSGLTQSGNSSAVRRVYDMTGDMGAGGSVYDITGPCRLKVDAGSSFGSNTFVTLRGANIHADLHVNNGTQPALKLVGCTDSFITLQNYSTSVSGVQSYTIDAASARCILITPNQATKYTVASTNLGTNCLVINELGAPPGGSAGGDLAGSYPNPTLGTATRAAAANAVLDTKVSGDTTNRFEIDADGKHQWGPGGVAALDTDLFRQAAGTLRSTSVLQIVSANNQNFYQARVTGDGFGRWNCFIDGSGNPGFSFGPGTSGGDVNLTRAASAKLGSDSDIAITTLGKTFMVKEGANAKMGVATLVGGTVTVSTTAVTASSRIVLTHQNASGTLGILSVGTVVAGTSFVINSSNALDTSNIHWLILEPA